MSTYTRTIITKFKQLVFFWSASFTIATIGYYLLYVIMPNHWVFGTSYRMFTYHWQHPMLYISIPCFFYGIIATIFSNKFLDMKPLGRILLTLAIIVSTVLFSSPFGGMLWHYHDMQAGYFPYNWFSKMVELGFSWGFSMGWLIIGLSIPYNIIGSIVCYYLTKKGATLFQN